MSFRSELEDDKRVVFVLYEIEELTMAEVAEAAGCPLQTAYSRLYAARRHVEAKARRCRAVEAGPSRVAVDGGRAAGGQRR